MPGPTRQHFQLRGVHHGTAGRIASPAGLPGPSSQFVASGPTCVAKPRATARRHSPGQLGPHGRNPRPADPRGKLSIQNARPSAQRPGAAHRVPSRRGLSSAPTRRKRRNVDHPDRKRRRRRQPGERAGLAPPAHVTSQRTVAVTVNVPPGSIQRAVTVGVATVRRRALRIGTDRERRARTRTGHRPAVPHFPDHRHRLGNRGHRDRAGRRGRRHLVPPRPDPATATSATAPADHGPGSSVGRRVGCRSAELFVDFLGFRELVFEDDDAAGGVDRGALVDEFADAGGEA